MEEKWLNVKNYEGIYQISNFGRVRSINRIIKTKRGYRKYRGKILRPGLGTDGYYHVNLSNIKDKSHSVHRLVAETFIKCDNKIFEVDHLDGNKLNNNVNNLKWTTHFENSSRANKGIYRRNPAFLQNNPRAKKVYCYKNGELIKEYQCAKIITIETGINYSTLRARLQKDNLIINGIKYTYYGN